MKVLLVVPQFNKPGGVTALFKILKMEQNFENISLFFLGNKLPSALRIPFKYFEFLYKLIFVDVIHLNPSLNNKSFLRDSVFAFLTLLFNRKLIVYWHGWDLEFEHKIKSCQMLRFVNSYTFLRADSVIVLGSAFKEKLTNFGFTNKIYLETNSAENKFITERVSRKISEYKKIELLFLSRLERNKGIYIVIEVFKLLNKVNNRFTLTIAGSGSEEDKVKNLISQIDGINWAGYVTDESKHHLLESSDIMFFPSFSEGLPLTLLEAIMYGLPVVSRPIGGIPDLIKNGENGLLIESLMPDDYANIINDLVNNPLLFNQISLNNIEKSKLFEPQIVRNRLFAIYADTYNSI